MAAKASSRGVFIRETIEVARRYGFDGVDLDWEFPQNPKQMGDFGFLLKEWSHAIQMEAKITKGLLYCSLSLCTTRRIS
ncbi:putative endochitinase [Morella rubra]|uniref:Putative endochitinase n=1 Tax=Morella rubra TaxID=262757 RepID=A0A6A1VLH2_9ROSI|nr:putative endochitinase [Morella rubra]